jgi:hypothetical protein
MENGKNEDREPDSGSSANGTFETQKVVDQPTSKSSEKSRKVEAEPSKKNLASHPTKPDLKTQFETNHKLHISLCNAERAYRSNKFTAAVKELQVAKTIAGSEACPVDPTSLIIYCEAIANLRSRSLEAIRTNYATLRSLTQNENESAYPCFFYALAKYQCVLKCPPSEIEKSLRECSQISRFRLPKMYASWSMKDVFPELSCPLTLRDLVLKMTQELRTPPPPGDIFLIL